MNNEATPTTLHTPAKAEAIAKAVREDDAEWIYTVVYFGTFAAVEVSDENGRRLGWL